MKVVALISGGKDSCFNMMHCIAAGHEIVALANLTPQSLTEIDSYMYQSVGHEAVSFVAQAMDLPLYKHHTLGLSSQQGKLYEPTTGDEVEDLYELLKTVKNQTFVEAVSVGAILSDYQRVRVENVCIRLGLLPLAFLWRRDQKELLDEMIKCGLEAVVIKVAALGLEPHRHLGRTLSSLSTHLSNMHEKYGLNVCGEGGEYETLTLDCPIFKSKIVINEFEIVMHSNDPVAAVGYLKLKKLTLQSKSSQVDSKEWIRMLQNSDGELISEGDNIEANEAPNSIEVMGSAALSQQATSLKSSDGWLWIGGVQGQSSDIAKATRQAMDTLKSILFSNGHTVQDVCCINLFISDMSQYASVNKIYCETFNHPNPASRICVEVPSEAPIIINALSWTPPLLDCGETQTERHTMHVQSRSHWAPANIGPYSQAVKVGDTVHLAGQIGLIPATLELAKGGINAECRLALRHVGRLLKAMDPNLTLRHVVQGICYVTNFDFIERAKQIWEEESNNAIVDYVVVSGLPKSALIEWHVWAHRHNNQFEYEETGLSIEPFLISVYRCWNLENIIAAIVCHIENNDSADLTQSVFVTAVDYVIKKLQQGYENHPSSIYNLTIFYAESKVLGNDCANYMEEIAKTTSMVYTIVPVLCLRSKHTLLSISGMRNH